MDVFTDPRAPKITHVLEPETILEETGLSWPHTSHCLGDGTIVIRCAGAAPHFPPISASWSTQPGTVVHIQQGF